MNPELRRNALLELRPAPCGAALAIVLLLVLPFVSRRGEAWSLDLERVMGVGLALFVFYSLWGVRKVSAGVTDEVRERTWDQQRLSSHTGWSLVVGKLFGTTAFTWYGAMGGLLLYALGQFRLMEPGPALLHLAILLTGALAAQALALWGSILAASRVRATRRGRSGWLQTLGLLAAAWVLLVLTLASLKALHLLETGWTGTLLAWWVPMPLEGWLPLTLAATFGWALLAAERAMRVELQQPVRPWGWVGFLAFLTAWSHPFTLDTLPGTTSPVLLLALIAGLGTWAAAVGERLDAVRLRFLVSLWRQGEGQALREALPLWTCSLGLTVACVATLCLGAVLGRLVPGLADLGRGCLPAATLAVFLLRDTALILAAQLATPRWRGPEGPVFVGALLLYVLLPLIASSLGKPFDATLALLLPGTRLDGSGNGLAGLLLAAPGCALALGLAGAVVRRALREPAASVRP